MKRVFYLLLLLGSSMSCHKDGVDAIQEANATIISDVSGPYAGCSYNYALLLEGDAEFHFHYTKDVPQAFSKPGTLVRIQYKLDESCKEQTPRPTNIITITSIRSR
ncbi:hypothetical protein [Fibrella forsythiae]|uniref:DUF4377 domain-containing protein n=1 Tax=Fibrella forsythiae TaxID=2817061 RepID=A0ABS3JCU6_9BACT|nr:hypothetical protein [Fibrella forsythiae]MBO0947263.1 hypothetical protein [Fibrella forsythiae]